MFHAFVILRENSPAAREHRDALFLSTSVSIKIIYNIKYNNIVAFSSAFHVHSV